MLASLDAQVLRGRIISSVSRTPMSDATVEALDSLRGVLVSARTDSAGRFVMVFSQPGAFRVRIRRIGIEPTLSDLLRFEGQDTVDIELLVDERAAVLDERTITGTGEPRELNRRRLADAQSRGWRVYPPERVIPARERAISLDQMLRSLGMANVMISQTCIRSLVTNGCLAIFIDDMYFGPGNFQLINVRDIEFVAVIGPTEALTTYGNRARHGILMLYTSRFEDRRGERDRRRP